MIFNHVRNHFLLTKEKTTKLTRPRSGLLSEADFGRLLKVVFIMNAGGDIEIETAYEPNETEMYIYNKVA